MQIVTEAITKFSSGDLGTIVPLIGLLVFTIIAIKNGMNILKSVIGFLLCVGAFIYIYTLVM